MDTLGAIDGWLEGPADTVGFSDGIDEGFSDSCADGPVDTLGTVELEGPADIVGCSDGIDEGFSDRCCDGPVDKLGIMDGWLEGAPETDGCNEGMLDGP